MPFLGEEPACYPEDLLTGFGADNGERRWWVLHTKARQEKSVARQLLDFEIPFYLPQVEKTSVYRGRKRSAFIPLFTGYVFLYGTEQDRFRSLTTNRIAQVLSVVDESELYNDLRQVWQLIAAKAPLTVESRLEPGQRVRVHSGALMGVEGTVVSRRKKCRLLVAVHLLQQGVSVEIDDFLLEPLD
ncbi:MAG: transcription termination/antitermination NusG family protein [Pirellulales bacterium]